MCDLNFHNTIAKLCLERFQSLPKSGKPGENEWTILSCIVLEDAGKFEVIALGTGTKCIGSDKMSLAGDILNDSHAEVICRRAFLRYIYEDMLAQTKKVVIFDSTNRAFSVKDCKFHFFSTQIMCGDAAIFAKQDIDYFGNEIRFSTSTGSPDSLKRAGNIIVPVEKKKIKLDDNKGDIFRTGAKCLDTDSKQDLRLEGGDFHVTGVVRTKPGRGVRTTSVSCSDKMAKWCHLGVQGALLSVLLSNPIYFSSVTIAGGTPYHKPALTRALFSRLGNLHLKHPYQRAEVALGQATLTFSHAKLEGKIPNPSSIIWLNSEFTPRQMEVAVDGRRQGVTKKQIKTSGALCICKKELFKKFIQVIKKFEIDLENINDLSKVTYKQVKLSSQLYQKSWTALKKSFNVWTAKDEAFIQFSATE